MAGKAMAECSAATAAPISGLLSSCSKQGEHGAEQRGSGSTPLLWAWQGSEAQAASSPACRGRPPRHPLPHCLPPVHTGRAYLAAAVGVQAKAGQHPHADGLQDQVQSEGDAPAHRGEHEQGQVGDCRGWGQEVGAGEGGGGGGRGTAQHSAGSQSNTASQPSKRGPEQPGTGTYLSTLRNRFMTQSKPSLTHEQLKAVGHKGEAPAVDLWGHGVKHRCAAARGGAEQRVRTSRQGCCQLAPP